MNTETMSKSSDRVRTLVEGALCVALSVVLSYFKIFKMPQGGSITLEMAPLLFFAYRHGFKWGVGVGALSGLFQLIFGGYIVHPFQAVLDYPLAFAGMGFLGLFQRRPILGIFIAGLSRLLCHVLSGVVFFSSYVPKGQNVWLYSILYNAGFMVPSLILAGFAAWLLWKRIPSPR